MDLSEKKATSQKVRQDFSRGQTFLEFLIVLPFLLVVIFGVFDLGRVFFSGISLVSAAREGARYLSAYPGDVSEGFSKTKEMAVLEATGGGIPLQEANIIVTCTNSDDDGDNCDSGSPAVVTVTHEFEMILGWVIPGPISITRSAQMIVP